MSNCGCGCNPCSCKNYKGNFTYVRYATNNVGTDFAKTIDAGGLIRCFQSIFISPIELNELAPAFPLFFTQWSNICVSDCGCCKWFDYHSGEDSSLNTFVWSGGALNQIDDHTFNNSFSSPDSSTGDVYYLTGFKGGDGLLLKSNEYCLEFEFDTTLFTNPSFSVSIQFGDGPGASVVSYSSTTAPPRIKRNIFAQSGIHPASTLIIKINAPGYPPTACPFLIKNLRLAPIDCCSNNFAIPQLRVKTKVLKNTTIGNNIAVLVANNVFGGKFVIQPRVEFYWDSNDLEFLNHNPQIWLFRMNNKAIRVRANYYGINTKLIVNKKGWRHPPTNDGLTYPGARYWGGKQAAITPSGFVTRTTEFPIVVKSHWTEVTQIDFLQWFSRKDNSQLIDGLTPPTVELKPMGHRDKTNVVKFRFAIVCDDPSVSQGKKIGELSDVVSVRSKILPTILGNFMKFYTLVSEDINHKL